LTCPRADGVELRAKVVTIRRKRVGNQPSKGAPVRLPATLPALNSLRCYAWPFIEIIEDTTVFYANLTSRTTPSRSDYTSGAALRDLGKPGTLHIVYCCFKKDLEPYNSSDGATVTVSLCTVTCFSMIISCHQARSYFLKQPRELQRLVVPQRFAFDDSINI
jgi:hypothetical protein